MSADLGVMLGYYRAPDQTAAAIDRYGWFNTGDLARMSDEGQSLYRGAHQGTHHPLRLQRLSGRGGAVLNAHELVVQSAVVGRNVEGSLRRWSRLSSFCRSQNQRGRVFKSVCGRASDLLQAAERNPVSRRCCPRRRHAGKILKHKLREIANESTIWPAAAVG